jgi:hypothetical protein
MAMTAFGRRLYMFGGVGATGTESILDVANDLWCFDTETLRWSSVGLPETGPSPRRCVGWTSYGDSLALWGGSGIRMDPTGNSRYDFRNDMWEFLPKSESWKLVRDTDDHRDAPSDAPQPDPAPPPRYTPVLHSIGHRRLFLFGGYTEDRLGKRKMNDAWILGDGAWTELPHVGRAGYSGSAAWPGLRYGCMSASSDDAIYVCGGFSDDGDHIDIWRFDPAVAAWSLLKGDDHGMELPIPRYCAVLAHFNDRLILFGGRSRRYPKLNFNDLWTFDLASLRWECILPNREPHEYNAGASFPGYHAKCASAVLGDSLYMWGGEGLHGHVSDFWRLNLAALRWEFLQAAREDDPRFW